MLKIFGENCPKKGAKFAGCQGDICQCFLNKILTILEKNAETLGEKQNKILISGVLAIMTSLWQLDINRESLTRCLVVNLHQFFSENLSTGNF
jgi:hypothetical protein